MIDDFRGENFFLSNFFPCAVEFEGDTYPSVEHAYQAAKTAIKTLRVPIRDCTTAASAKKAGRKLEVRPDWEAIKLLVMFECLTNKFKNSELAAKLLATGDQELVEGNNWGDTYWGRCGGKGENHLGRQLMRIRDTLRKGKEK